MRHELFGCEIAHQPVGAHFLPPPVKKQDGGWADYSKFFHQFLVEIVIGRHVCLQQLQTAKLCLNAGILEGIFFHADALNTPVGIKIQHGAFAV